MNEPVRQSVTHMFPSRSNLRAEGVFVVVTADFPAVGEGLERVGSAVAVVVLERERPHRAA